VTTTWSPFFNKSVVLGAFRDFREELQKQNAQAIVGTKSVGRLRRAKRAVALDVSTAIYSHPTALRRFAEQLRDGALGSHLSWVYFIGYPNGSVKIGVSGDPRRRLADLQRSTPEPLELLAVAQGDHAVEALLHKVFAPDHVRGEWFRRSETLTEFVRVLALTKSVDP
jgi:hypothetical protein